jgi:uncharacterized protein
MATYLDSSALAKLVIDEPETDALRRTLRTATRPVTSDLARTELMRSVRRHAEDRMVMARLVLDSVSIMSMPASTFDAAGRLDPANLRSLDALHLAAALELGDDLDGFITYDRRLAEAATALGLPVTSPA